MCLVRYPGGDVGHVLISAAIPDRSRRCFCCGRVEMLFLSDATCCTQFPVIFLPVPLSSGVFRVWVPLCCSGLVKTWLGLPLSTCPHSPPSNPVIQPQGPHGASLSSWHLLNAISEMSHIGEGQNAKMKKKKKKTADFIFAFGSEYLSFC